MVMANRRAVMAIVGSLAALPGGSGGAGRQSAYLCLLLAVSAELEDLLVPGGEAGERFGPEVGEFGDGPVPVGEAFFERSDPQSRTATRSHEPPPRTPPPRRENH